MINAISKTDQLKEIIIKELKRGVYKHGETLPSIQEFCRRYGVSKHTVSQALSNLSELGLIDTAPGKLTRVSDKLSRRRVEIAYVGDKAIEQQEFWAEVYEGIVGELNKHSDIEYRVKSLVVDRDNPQLHTDIVHTSAYLLLGVVSYEWLEYLNQNEIPAIMVYERLKRPDCSWVSVDYAEALDQLVGMFAGQGRRRIAFINRFPGQDKPNINFDKFQLFRQMLEKHGLKEYPEFFVHNCKNIRDTYLAATEILKNDHRPDGIFLSSDTIAPGVYRALHETKLTIPQDVAVAGCDNLEISSFMVPSLTTIELSRSELGRSAAVALLEQLNNSGKPFTPVQRCVKPEVIIRESLN